MHLWRILFCRLVHIAALNAPYDSTHGAAFATSAPIAA